MHFCLNILLCCVFQSTFSIGTPVRREIFWKTFPLSLKTLLSFSFLFVSSIEAKAFFIALTLFFVFCDRGTNSAISIFFLYQKAQRISPPTVVAAWLGPNFYNLFLNTAQQPVNQTVVRKTAWNLPQTNWTSMESSPTPTPIKVYILTIKH